MTATLDRSASVETFATLPRTPRQTRPLAYGSGPARPRTAAPRHAGESTAPCDARSPTGRFREGASQIHIATPQLQLPSKPAALVLRAARLSGPVFRDDAAAQTGLSISTVNRQVGALLKAGLIRERADLAPAGAIGRPRLPFELNVTDFLTVGIHIGYKVTAITTYDLLHRVVGAIQIATPTAENPGRPWPRSGPAHDSSSDAGPDVACCGPASRSVAGCRTAASSTIRVWAGRRPRRPGDRRIARAARVGGIACEAMAAAELVVNPDDKRSSFLYFYAREMVGIAFSVDGTVHPAAGPPVIGHFPRRRHPVARPAVHRTTRRHGQRHRHRRRRERQRPERAGRRPGA